MLHFQLKVLIEKRKSRVVYRKHLTIVKILIVYRFDFSVTKVAIKIKEFGVRSPSFDLCSSLILKRPTLFNLLLRISNSFYFLKLIVTIQIV